MKLLVVFLVSFLLGVAVRAMWIMAFPLAVTSEMISASSIDITSLTFRTLMSMLWFGLLVALCASGCAGLVMVFRHLTARRIRIKKSLPET